MKASTSFVISGVGAAVAVAGILWSKKQVSDAAAAALVVGPPVLAADQQPSPQTPPPAIDMSAPPPPPPVGLTPAGTPAVTKTNGLALNGRR